MDQALPPEFVLYCYYGNTWTKALLSEFVLYTYCYYGDILSLPLL